MTTLLWGVALRFGGYSRASNRAYMAELANTNQVRSLGRGGPHCAGCPAHCAVSLSHSGGTLTPCCLWYKPPFRSL